ncbi:Bystin-domain-containing protein [Mycotypha africana]|uniref:Bystin-domain-containing protein n=1 Tax=Mycotypha africana TaxID=64632 RepID=UPI002301A08B|nr:Bystin-domain-containing protein [Mycotypha africana]KAI8975180.1 Bystin-domain-containing protein [Mycotypha africana]
MGKDTNKVLCSNIANKSYIPWKTDPTAKELNRKTTSRFGLLMRDEGLKFTVDEDVAEIISAIEKAQMDKLKQFKEDDIVDDDLFVRETSSLKIFSTSANDISNIAQDSMTEGYEEFFIPPCDLLLHRPSSYQNKFMMPTLEDYISSKNEAENPSAASPSLSTSKPSVIRVYTDIGELFAKQELSSILKIQKAIKIIPSLSNWEEILLLTKPTKWSPRATFDVSKVFLNNVKAKQLKSYFQYVLLYLVRAHLHQNERLNYYLEKAISISIKSAPGLFIKGFLNPLIESNSCTLKEATTIGCIIHKTRIPSSHICTALLSLTEQQPTAPLPIHALIFAFLLKKPTLDYRAINALVVRYFSCQKFSSFTTTTTVPTVLPMTWYHSLYIFVKNYNVDMIPSHKKKLLIFIGSIERNDFSNKIEQMLLFKAKQSDFRNYSEDRDSFFNIQRSTDDESLHSDDSGIISHSEAYNVLNGSASFSSIAPLSTNMYSCSNMNHHQPSFLLEEKQSGVVADTMMLD